MPQSMDLPKKKKKMTNRLTKSESSDNIRKYSSNCHKDSFSARTGSGSGLNDRHQYDDDDDDDDYLYRNELLLIPNRSQFCSMQNQSRLSPPLVPQSAFDCSDLEECLNGENNPNEANVSSMRTALSNIQEFVETTVVLRKDKKNELGISIVGGNDTYLVSRVFVFHLF